MLKGLNVSILKMLCKPKVRDPQWCTAAGGGTVPVLVAYHLPSWIELALLLPHLIASHRSAGNHRGIIISSLSQLN